MDVQIFWGVAPTILYVENRDSLWLCLVGLWLFWKQLCEGGCEKVAVGCVLWESCKVIWQLAVWAVFGWVNVKPKPKKPKPEKHLLPCFPSYTGFGVAFRISSFARFAVWLGLWLISRKSHSKSPTKHSLRLFGIDLLNSYTMFMIVDPIMSE